MKKDSKYFDWENRVPLYPPNNGCSFDHWKNNQNNAKYSVHDKGFLVFLPYSDLGLSDEYKDDDPYTVEESINSDFHQRRINITLDLLDKSIENKQKNIKILDLGCGQGHITGIIKKRYPNSEISGLDYSISAIEYAVSHFNSVDFIVGNAYSPPYSPEYFDAVICNNLWEHVPDPIFLLGKIRAILKKDGVAIISTPSRYRLQNLVRVLAGKPVRFMSEYHVTEYTIGQVLEQLRFGKFSVVSISSQPVRNTGRSIKGIVLNKIIAPCINIICKSIGSHHSLESTVFYLARKVD